MTGWKDILRPIRDGYHHLFPSPDTGPSPEEREKQRQAHLALGFTYFDTFDQLEAWSKDGTCDTSRANTPLLPRPQSDKGQKQTSNVLLCHDYGGNYHDYESAVPLGVDQEFYSCEYLQHVDSFIYFSHKLICVPPPSWTNTLHRNGVKVLGTLLVEPQTKDADRLLNHVSRSDCQHAGPNLHFPIIEKLSEIVNFYGFDGWLINIEKPFSEECWDAQVLESFLRNLREALGDAAELIWYDALTIDNKIAYQNAATKKNMDFAMSCGAILTNYSWTEGGARSSKDVAEASNLPLDKVYLGVDVWAQNKTTIMHPRITYPERGGGGTNTGVAVSKLAEMGLSVGIFAPAWSFEHFPISSHNVEQALWEGGKLADGTTCSCLDTTTRHPSNTEHPITRSATQYPAGSDRFFYTEFSRAFSEHTHEEAQRVYKDKGLHSQLGSQSILPLPKTRTGSTPELVNTLTRRLAPGPNKSTLVVDIKSATTPKDTSNQRYERELALYKLDMPADSSLQLTIACRYRKPSTNTATNFYLKYYNGLTKSIRLEDHNDIQVIDHILDSIRLGGEPDRIQEIGVSLDAPFLSGETQLLEVFKLRIVPRMNLEIHRVCDIYDMRLEQRGLHWLLRWSFRDISPAVVGMPYSSLTGPFSCFAIRVDGLELGRAYALTYVLPNHLVESFTDSLVVEIVGVGFDGRELGRVSQKCSYKRDPLAQGLC